MLLPLYDDNPNQRLPVVTVGLIAINVLVFLYSLSLTHTGQLHLVYAAGFLPARVIGDVVPPGVDYLPLSFTSLPTCSSMAAGCTSSATCGFSGSSETT